MTPPAWLLAGVVALAGCGERTESVSDRLDKLEGGTVNWSSCSNGGSGYSMTNKIGGKTQDIQFCFHGDGNVTWRYKPEDASK